MFWFLEPFAGERGDSIHFRQTILHEIVTDFESFLEIHEINLFMKLVIVQFIEYGSAYLKTIEKVC